jgi:hypothetical protein
LYPAFVSGDWDRPSKGETQMPESTLDSKLFVKIALTSLEHNSLRAAVMRAQAGISSASAKLAGARWWGI